MSNREYINHLKGNLSCDTVFNFDLISSGPRGEKGENGKSAYELWLSAGNEGTLEEFLSSLKADTNYELMENLPSINNIVLKGNLSFAELGLEPISLKTIEDLWEVDYE